MRIRPSVSCSLSLSLTDQGTATSAKTYSFAYTPTGHGADAQTVTLDFANGSADGTNQAFTQSVVLDGLGVGPELGTSLAGSTLDLGVVRMGTTASLPLTLFNTTPDGEFGALTDLTILDAYFTGADAARYWLRDFTPGSVIHRGGSLDLDLRYAPLFEGLSFASLTIMTDVGAALGELGASYTIGLTAQAVPEPGTAALALLALGGVAMRARRRA